MHDSYVFIYIVQYVFKTIGLEEILYLWNNYIVESLFLSRSLLSESSILFISALVGLPEELLVLARYTDGVLDNSLSILFEA